MKSLFFTFLIASSATVAMAAESPSLTGKWQLHQTIADNESDMSCTFTQTASDLAGACTGDAGTVKITGKVDGAKISWVYKSEYNGGPITLNYKGNLGSAADKITGTVDVEEYGADGDFTATRAK